MKEGEVFVKINPYERNKEMKEFSSVQIRGKVLVTRSPWVHPGDIRVLKAVYKEELRYLTNIIVFPSNGMRPEQDKMGTGDLDGDIYWISWNKTFIYQYKEYPPEEKRC